MISRPLEQEQRLSYLLHNLPVLEDVLQCYIKLAKVVLSHTVPVPANSFEQHALYAHDREIEGGIPFWIEIFADGRGRFLRVPQRDDEKLACVLENRAIVDSG